MNKCYFVCNLDIYIFTDLFDVYYDSRLARHIVRHWRGARRFFSRDNLLTSMFTTKIEQNVLLLSLLVIVFVFLISCALYTQEHIIALNTCNHKQCAQTQG